VYRAPEVILTCRNYDEKIDIWSMGCILGELLTLTPAYARMQAHIQAQNNNNYRFIFQGDSCYPISPCVEINSVQTPNHEKCYSSDDQVAKIIRKLGYLSPSDKSYIEAKSKLDYLEYFQKYVESTREENYESTIEEQFQDSPQEVVSMLTKLLSFSPNARLSAADCLKNKIFD
jgi:serine/threonine protein kinase